VLESGRQRGFESFVDVEDRVGVCQFEHVEDPGGGGDEAELAAADLHVAIENHQGPEARAVDELNAGEFEDKFIDTIIGSAGDFGFNLTQTHTESHATGQTEDSRSCIDAL
jgi:hypothetical protein